MPRLEAPTSGCIGVNDLLLCLSFPTPIGNPGCLLSGYPPPPTVGALSTGMTTATYKKDFFKSLTTSDITMS